MLEKICDLALKAGNEVMHVYNNKTESINFINKHDNSPLTKADINSNIIITQGLLELTPNLPILSEENISSWEIRKNWEKYWLIDPLDGTKEFIKHKNEFTINIALIEKTQPILGVVYAPALNIMYSATQNMAWKEEINNKNKCIIHANKNYTTPLSIVISNSHAYDDEKMKEYLNRLKLEYKIFKIGSSLKFCLIAEGKAQIYLRFGKTKIWDTAAGHIIATASGAYVSDLKGKNLSYNLKIRSLFNSDFCVYTDKNKYHRNGRS